MLYLLDTSVAVMLRDDDDAASEAVGRLANSALSVLTVVELLSGVYADQTKTVVRRARLDAMLEGFATVPFDDRAAVTYGRIVARSGYSRKLVMDRMIAATALVIGATLVTAKHRDFAGIPRLSILPLPPG